jgi:predicted RNA-binding protein with PIN domain
VTAADELEPEPVQPEEGQTPAALPTADPAKADVPPEVRDRMGELAAEALGRLPADQVPAALRRIAAFTPSRRGKLAGDRILEVLERDPVFRSRLREQVREAEPAVVAALEGGTVPEVAAVDAAAVACLLRTPDWPSALAAASTRAGDRAGRAEASSADHVDRLQRQLDAAVEEAKALRRRNRDQVTDLKRQNAELRHKLGDARARLRAAEEATAAAEAAAAEAGAAASATASAQEAELRRLRSRLDQLEAELAGQRRAGRAERGTEAMRARLLLDTLLETAQGLRRELALPAVPTTPADLVEAHIAEEGSRASSGHGSMASDDPALLDQLLALPRAHLIVDGYNVTKTSWPELSLERQRERLLAGLAPLAARSGAEVTVVFDASEIRDRPLVNRPRGVRVLYSPAGVIADDVIRELVAAEPLGRPVVVVTSDQAVVRDVVRDGARVAGALSLARVMSRS